MSLNNPSASDKNSLEELKAKLDVFITRNSITQFESEDIVELIEEGESPDWIVDQLKNNSPAMDGGEILPLLQEIQTLSGPSTAPESGTEEAHSEEVPEEPAIGNGIPDLSQIDPSSLDFSQIADALPPGIELPPGIDMNQIKDLMESPQGKIMSDFLLFCSEKGIEMNENLLNDPRTEDLRNEWKATPREAFDGKTPAEMMGDSGSGFLPEKIQTFRHEEPRIGRNDPCPCGSGKKYKKCCGK